MSGRKYKVDTFSIKREKIQNTDFSNKKRGSDSETNEFISDGEEEEEGKEIDYADLSDELLSPILTESYSKKNLESFETESKRDDPYVMSETYFKKNGNSNNTDKLTSKRKKIDSEGNGTNRKRWESSASGKMIGNRVVFDDIQDDFTIDNIDDIRKQEPPYAPQMNDGEFSSVINHEIERDKARRRLLEDKFYRFITIVAGLTNTDEKMLRSSPSGRASSIGDSVGTGVYSGGGGGGGRGVALTTTTSPLATTGGPLFSPRTSPKGGPVRPVGMGHRRSISETGGERDVVDVGRGRGRGEERPPGFGIGLGRGRTQRESGEPNVYELIKDPTWGPSIENWLSRQRIHNNLQWIERPDVLGIMDMSPLLYGNMRFAHTSIRMECPSLHDVTIEQLIEDDDQIALLYAQLTSIYIGLARNYNSTRVQLDQNRNRLRQEKIMLMNALKKYEFDSFSQKFSMKTSLISHSNGFATSSSGLLLPRFI